MENFTPITTHAQLVAFEGSVSDADNMPLAIFYMIDQLNCYGPQSKQDALGAFDFELEIDVQRSIDLAMELGYIELNDNDEYIIKNQEYAAVVETVAAI